MRGNTLLDTGPIVALLHAGDAYHRTCRDLFESFSGRFFTTEAVLTEALHLLRRFKRGQKLGLEFFLRGAATLVPQSRESLKRCLQLMERYANVPMDFADATLVALGEDLGIGQVFTIDRRGFDVYRAGRRAFKVFP
jgi:hypothetical protein